MMITLMLKMVDTDDAIDDKEWWLVHLKLKKDCVIAFHFLQTMHIIYHLHAKICILWGSFIGDYRLLYHV